MPIKEIVAFFIQYKYQAIFPLALVEGPIATIVSGFLVSSGTLEFIPALFLVFIADVFSDSIFYCIGRAGRYLVKYLKWKHISEEKLLQVEERYHRSVFHTMIVAKVSIGLGTVFMVAAGAAKLPIKTFLVYVIPLNFLRSLTVLFIGYYFGKAALSLGESYAWYYAILLVIIVPLAYILIRKRFFKTKQAEIKANTGHLNSPKILGRSSEGDF